MRKRAAKPNDGRLEATEQALREQRFFRAKRAADRALKLLLRGASLRGRSSWLRG
jgi:hypothetical protein